VENITKIAQVLCDKSIAEVQSTVPDVPSGLPLNVSKLPGNLLSKAEISITEGKPEQLLDARLTSECRKGNLFHQNGALKFRDAGRR
jgi:hypothetical protein